MVYVAKVREGLAEIAVEALPTTGADGGNTMSDGTWQLRNRPDSNRSASL
jgi:hypothetical protein